MMPWWSWIAWAALSGASFLGLETWALRGGGQTLSTKVRRFFGTNSKDARRRRVGIASFLTILYGFAVWFGWHITGG